MMRMKTMKTDLHPEVEKLLKESSLHEDFLSGKITIVKFLDAANGINVDEVDAVVKGDNGVAFLKEFDVSTDPKDCRLFIFNKARWALAKSRKDLAISVYGNSGLIIEKEQNGL